MTWRPVTPARIGGLAAALVALAPTASLACPPADPGAAFDLPVVTTSDGSFERASENDEASVFYGEPARDIGGGRVGQRIVEGMCLPAQLLLFADCTTGEAIVVHGIPVLADDEAGFSTSVRALQPPRGPLALTAATTVAEVAAMAAREGWRVTTDVQGLAAARGPGNRFDPFMGCRVLYPGSAGAGS